LGGRGSGRRPSRPYRRIAENAQPLDIRRLTRAGVLDGRIFQWVWTIGDRPVAVLTGRLSDGNLLVWGGGVLQRLSDHGPRQALSVVWTRCTYGGSRPWWRCTGCGGRAAVLFRPAGHYACRQCHGIVYGSQLEGLMDRALRRAQRVRRRLGGSADMSVPFPWKPKWMRWRTYRRLRWFGESARGEWVQGLSVSLGIPQRQPTGKRR
jgi:hypothetical protein